jgi:hypothetical protein
MYGCRTEIAALDAKWTALWESAVAQAEAGRQRATDAADLSAEQLRSLVEVIAPLQQRLSIVESSRALVRMTTRLAPTL